MSTDCVQQLIYLVRIMTVSTLTLAWLSSVFSKDTPEFHSSVARSSAPVFVKPIPSPLYTTGKALTFGIDVAHDASVTVSATTSNPGIMPVVPRGNRFARLNFRDHNDEQLGSMMFEIFEQRGGLAAERFILLSTNGIDEQGNIDESAPPYYTNVAVHRVAELVQGPNNPGLIIQTGDVQNGDGTGGSPLGRFDDQFEIQGGLNFSRGGVLAMANSGPDTNDSQFFITDDPVPHLDGRHMIFGQMISGQTVIDQIAALPRDGSATPKLASVDIFENSEDGAITMKPAQDFIGKATVTVTARDDEGNQVQQQIEVSRLIRPIAEIAAVQPESQTVDGNRLYVVVSGAGLSVYDISDMSSPELLGSETVPTIGLGNNVVISDYPGVICGLSSSEVCKIAFLAAAAGGVIALNVTDPGNIVRLDQVEVDAGDPAKLGSNAMFVALDERRILYVAANTGGIVTFDAGTPGNLGAPSGVFLKSDDLFFRQILVRDSVAYASIVNFGIVSINVANASQLTVIDDINPSEVSFPWGIDLEEDRLYVAELGSSGVGSALSIWDVSSAGDMTFINRFPLANTPWQVAANTTMTVVGHGDGGFTVLNTADAAELFVETTFTTNYSAFRPTLHGNRVFLPIHRDGIVIADITALYFAEISVGIDDRYIPNAGSETIHIGTGMEGDGGVTATLQIYNDGNDSLTLGAVTLPDGFQIDGTMPSVIGEDQMALMTIRMATDQVGARSGQMEIINNDPDESPYVFTVAGDVIGGGRISGVVWNDRNRNLTRDANEEGISSIPVYIDANQNSVFDATEPNTTTLSDDAETAIDETGRYAFENLASGSYLVRIEISTTLVQEFPAAAEGYAISLNPGGTAENRDFGIRNRAGSIAGRVWEDNDGDKTIGPTEKGIADAVVFIDVNDNGQRDNGEPQRVTPVDDDLTPDDDESGAFQFDDLVPGNYVVRLVLPDDFFQTYPIGSGEHPVAVSDLQISTGIDFGIAMSTAIISGRVWLDTNANGIRDPNESGLGGVAIYLDANEDGGRDAGEPLVYSGFDRTETEVDEAGTYRFSGLTPGSYIIRQILSATYQQTFPANDSGRSVAANSKHETTDIDFGGLTAAGDVSGVLWEDRSDDLEVDPGEPRFDLVDIRLYIDDGDELIDYEDDVLLARQLTTGGEFHFNNMISGKYWIEIDELTPSLEGVGLAAVANPAFAVVDSSSPDIVLKFPFRDVATDQDGWTLTPGWNLISTSIKPKNSLVAEIFSTTSRDDTGRETAFVPDVVWSWKPVGGSGVFERSLKIKALAGMWLYDLENRSVTFDGFPLRNASLYIEPGWNLIGVDRTVALPIRDGLSATAWVWGNRRFDKATSLEAGRGYWIFSEIAVRLRP